MKAVILNQGPMNNVEIYGIEKAVKYSKLPMAIFPDTLDGNITDRVSQLAQAPQGSGHDNFLKGILIEGEIVLTVKMMVQLERYHFFEIISSQSTMHRLPQMLNKVEPKLIYDSNVHPEAIELMKRILKEYLEEEDKDKKNKLKLQLLMTNPQGIKLILGFATNYQALKTMYRQRRHHFLPEWKALCAQIEELPYSEWITGGKEYEEN